MKIALSAISIAISVFYTWWTTAEYKDAIWTARIATIQKDASEALETETKRVLLAENKWREALSELEIKDSDNKKSVEKLSAENRDLVRRNNGLRDPGKTDCSSSESENTDSIVSTGEASGTLLSERLSEFLLSRFREADRAAVYANTCYDIFQLIKQKQK